MFKSLCVYTMATQTPVPKVLILGHSFVRCVKSDLRAGFDARAAADFGLGGTVEMRMHGVGGRTVQKTPDVVLLELGNNELATLAPEVVGPHIEDLVQLLPSKYSVRLVIWCQVTPRTTVKRHVYHNADFNENAALLNQYMRVVLEPLPRAICWKHKGFSVPAVFRPLLTGWGTF